MGDVIELIEAEHFLIRQLFAELDRLMDDDGPAVGVAWAALAGFVECHVDAEDEVCGLVLYDGKARAVHTAVTADVHEAVAEARLHPPGSELWRLAVRAACFAALRHVNQLEPGVVARFRRGTSLRARHELGCQWVAYIADRAHDGNWPVIM